MVHPLMKRMRAIHNIGSCGNNNDDGGGMSNKRIKHDAPSNIVGASVPSSSPSPYSASSSASAASVSASAWASRSPSPSSSFVPSFGVGGGDRVVVGDNIGSHRRRRLGGVGDGGGEFHIHRTNNKTTHHSFYGRIGIVSPDEMIRPSISNQDMFQHPVVITDNHGNGNGMPPPPFVESIKATGSKDKTNNKTNKSSIRSANKMLTKKPITDDDNKIKTTSNDNNDNKKKTLPSSPSQQQQQRQKQNPLDLLSTISACIAQQRDKEEKEEVQKNFQIKMEMEIQIKRRRMQLDELRARAEQVQVDVEQQDHQDHHHHHQQQQQQQLIKGIKHYPNGSTYQGHFLQNTRHGFGSCHYPNGCIYIGYWMHGKRHGIGKMLYLNGDVYQGEWREDRRHGVGVYYYSYCSSSRSSSGSDDDDGSNNNDGKNDDNNMAGIAEVCQFIQHEIVGEGVQFSPCRTMANRLVNGRVVGRLEFHNAVDLCRWMGLPGIPKREIPSF